MAEICKHVPKHPQRRAAIIAVSGIHQDNVHPIGRSVNCGKINHFREVCSSRRSTAVHNIKQVPDQCDVEEDHIDMENSNSFIF